MRASIFGAPFLLVPKMLSMRSNYLARSQTGLPGMKNQVGKATKQARFHRGSQPKSSVLCKNVSTSHLYNVIFAPLMRRFCSAEQLLYRKTALVRSFKYFGCDRSCNSDPKRVIR